MNVMLNRLDPNLPDPVESRRRAAGRLVRIAYATAVFGILIFFIVYFGRPLVYLGGPGIVSSPRYVVSLPYTVQISHMNIAPGVTVQAREEIGRVRSPEHDGIVANYMRSLTDVAGRKAELRIKARVAQESLESARSYLRLAEDAADLVEASSASSVSFRIEIFRERAAARKVVAAQEAEAAEATAQLAALDEISIEIRERLDQLERSFANGRVLAPIGGIVSTNVARVGQSLVAGSPIAEILDPTDVFVDWYVPNERFLDPKIGHDVLVVFGRRRMAGTVVDILPVSDVYAGRQGLVMRDRPATQIARIRFSASAVPPALNATVYVHMHYTALSASVAGWLIDLLGLQ
jgi:multidrug efflux pump subunit AcrA (membrane-fusion protein)